MYKCPFCGKQFTSQKGYKVHLARIHYQEYIDYLCSEVIDLLKKREYTTVRSLRKELSVGIDVIKDVIEKLAKKDKIHLVKGCGRRIFIFLKNKR